MWPICMGLLFCITLCWSVFVFTTISPKRRKALQINRKIDLISHFLYKFCIEVFVSLIMFAKIGPVTGNLESLQGAEWWPLVELSWLRKLKLDPADWGSCIHNLWLKHGKIFYLASSQVKKSFAMKLHNTVCDRGMEVIHGKYCIKKPHVLFVSTFCIIW